MKIHRMLVLSVMALASGCATTPPPTGLLDRAEGQIRAADAAGAATRAPADFAEAQRRYALAQAAIANGDNDQAAASAEEAAAAAETARARARAVDLADRIRSQRDENSSLQSELDQKQADAAAAAQQAASQPASGSSSQELPPIQLGAPQGTLGASAPAPADSDAFPPSDSSVPAGDPSQMQQVDPASGGSSGNLEGQR